MVESANNAVMNTQGRSNSLKRVGQRHSPKRPSSPTKEPRREVMKYASMDPSQYVNSGQVGLMPK